MCLRHLLLLALASFSCTSIFAGEVANANAPTLDAKPGYEEISPEDLSRLSHAFGHFIGKNLNGPGVAFDLENLIAGIRDGAAGKPSNMSESEYNFLLAKVQEKAVKQMSQDNLKKADNYLTENGKLKNIVQLENGKLQYEVLKEGSGAVVKEHATPQIRYTGRFIDGTVFGSSEGMEAPISIPLDHTIPGFSKGLIGMKEGEHRRLFIHPDLAYGTTGELPPNELLIFDIEVVKADSQPVDMPKDDAHACLDYEIGLPICLDEQIDDYADALEVNVSDDSSPLLGENTHIDLYDIIRA